MQGETWFFSNSYYKWLWLYLDHFIDQVKNKSVGEAVDMLGHFSFPDLLLRVMKILRKCGNQQVVYSIVQ